MRLDPRRLLICVLVGLSGCLNSGDSYSSRNRNDLAQLGSDLAAFQQRFGVSPTSRIKLSETCDYLQRDQPGTLDADSVAFLNRLWPRLSLAPGTRLDWNGDGQIAGDWVLEGDECLVFFLGGVPCRSAGVNGCLGFSADPDNPIRPPRGNETRVSPFYEFRCNRLKDVHGRGFFSYLDPYYQQPYAYFSAARYGRNGETDCPTLGVWPYAEALQPEPRYW